MSVHTKCAKCKQMIPFEFAGFRGLSVENYIQNL